jgi:tetratricopeptide (TPR) repeat protein
MSTTRQCTECGTPLSGEMRQGECPVCALRGALGLPEESPQAAVTEKAGDRIGRYKLLEKIGEGGYGVVYMAEQAEPIRRRVALKVVKLGMDTKQVIARFEAERQALALMDHPNIAKVLDAGATDTGRPYFVMELVRGVRITDYCNQHKLATKERLGLFMQVCHAVQHAHQKGIIHRDIKPSNILVTKLDGVAVPKVIDFGIAKATQQPLTNRTVFTAFQQFIGTPAYMSPEQAELSGADVDTRSDIYSLGVLLYELVTGHTPFETRELMLGGLEEMRRLIREREPARPSTRLRALSLDDLTTVARHQQTEPPRLIYLVRGDLDWIVMKCLEKDRTRRYETATGLAQDVERHLQNEPVTAAAPSALYRVGKFVRRHRLGLFVNAMVASIVVAGVVVGLQQADAKVQALKKAADQGQVATNALQRLELSKLQLERDGVELSRQRDAAQAASLEATNQWLRAEKALMVASDEAVRANKEAAKAGEEAAKARAAEESARKDQAGMKAARDEASKREVVAEELSGFMLGELSEKLLPVGRVDLLTNITQRALAHYKSQPTQDQSEEAKFRRFQAYKNLGYALAVQGNSAQALESYQEALAIADILSSDTSATTNWQAELYSCHRGIGDILQARGDFRQALEEFGRSLKIAQECADHFPGDTRWLRCSLASQVRIGNVLWASGDRRRADATNVCAFNTALQLEQIDPQNAGWQHELSANSSEMGALLVHYWGVEKALKACEKGLALAQQRATNDHSNARYQADLATAHENLGDVLLVSKAMKDARSHYQEAMSIRYLLVERDPANTDWQRDFLRSSLKISHALSYETRRSKTVTMVLEQHKAFWDFVKKPFELAAWQTAASPGGADALRTVTNSVEAARQLAQKDPANVQWQDDLARGLSFRGDMLFRSEQFQAALKDYREAEDIRQSLARGDTNAFYPQYRLAASEANVAATLWRLKRQEEASAKAQSTLDLLATRLCSWPSTFMLLEALRVDPRNPKSRLLLNQDQRKDFMAAVRQGFDLARKQSAGAGQSVQRQEEWGACCSRMAVASLLDGEFAQGTNYAGKEVAMWRQLCCSAPATLSYKSRLAGACTALGALQLLGGKPEAAIQSGRLGLETEPSSAGGKAILALGCFCTDQADEGLRILLQNRALDIGPNQAFPEAVLTDLRRLHGKGLTQIDLDKIEQRLAAGSPQTQ